MQITKLNSSGWLRFQNLLVSQLVQKFATFYGTRRSIMLSRKPTNCPCPEPDESIPRAPIPLFHIYSILRFVLFWDITQRRVVIPYGRFGTTYPPQLQGSKRNSLALENRTDWLSRLFGKELTLCAALYPRRSQIWTTLRLKPELALFNITVPSATRCFKLSLSCRFSTKSCKRFPSPHYAPLFPGILSSLIKLHEAHLFRSRDHEAPAHAVFSNLLLLPTCWALTAFPTVIQVTDSSCRAV